MNRSPRFLSIVGTRPHLTKLAPVSRAFEALAKVEPTWGKVHSVIHTGQHYDAGLADDFLRPLGLPRFDVQLQAGGRAPHEQLAYLISELTPLIKTLAPDLVLVYGDTTSTTAAAIAARMAACAVAHVEAGLREFDLSIPEEVNKRIVDGISSLFLCPSQRAAAQLRAEGVIDGLVVTGDTALDLQHWNPPLEAVQWWARMGFGQSPFALCTFHRAVNTDNPTRLRGIIDALGLLDMPVLLPLHPRTRAALRREGLGLSANVRAIEPVGFFELQIAMARATLVLTDSGGVTKEAYQLSKSIVLLDDQTEWVEGVEDGFVIVAGADPRAILDAVGLFPTERSNSRPYGTGDAGQKVVLACCAFVAGRTTAKELARAPYRRYDTAGRNSRLGTT